MNKIIKGTGLALLFICLALATVAQTVNVSLLMKPPHSAYLDHYRHLENKVVVTLTNLTGTQQQVYLKGKLENQSEGLYVQSGANYRPSMPIVLQPNQTKVITADATALRYLDEGNAETNASEQLKANILRTGQLPEGVYKICVQAFDFNTGLSLSDAITGCATINITHAGPPQITFPLNDQRIAVQQRKTVSFNWTPPMGNLAGGNVSYDLITVKLLPGQNPNEAIRAARDYNAGNPTIRKTDLKIQSYTRQAYDLEFEPGYTYAVQVVAKDKNSRLMFLNKGQSEVIVFHVDNDDTELQVRNTGPVRSNGNTPGFTRVTPGKLAFNTFKGKLDWAFPKEAFNTNGAALTNISAGNTGLGSGSIVDLGNYGVASQGAGKALIIDYSPGGSGNTTLIGGSGIGVGTPANIPGIATNQPKSKLEQLNEAHQKAINEAISGDRHPLAFTEVKLVAKLNPYELEKLQITDPFKYGGNVTDKVLGYATTDAQGNFSLNYYGDPGVFYTHLELQIENYYFDYASLAVPMVKNQTGVYDIGTLTGLAKSYALKIKVTDEKGNELKNAKIKIRRQQDFYTQPKSNGNLKWELDNKPGIVRADASEPHVKEIFLAEGVSSSVFNKAFFNLSFSDRYNLSIRATGAEPMETFLDLKLNGKVEGNAGLVIERTIIMTLANPSISGKVVEATNGISLADATVVLHKEGEGFLHAMFHGTALTAVSKSDGSFKITDIPVAQTPYQITVIYKGAPTILEKIYPLNGKGIELKDEKLKVDATLLGVCGVVNGVDGKPLANVKLHWKTGGQSFYTDDKGQFWSVQTLGKHKLVAEKPGYMAVEKELEVKVPDDEQLSEVTTDPGQGAGNLQQQLGNLSGLSGGGNFATEFKQIVPPGSLLSKFVFCGNELVMKHFYVKITVKAEGTYALVADAIVSTDGGKKIKTKADGTAVLDDVNMGQSNIYVEAPPGKGLASGSAGVMVTGKDDTLKVTVLLKPGTVISGVVKAKGQPVKDAEVYVDTKEYIKTLTKADGSYTLNGVPLGEYSVIAAKPGFLADTKKATFEKGKTYTLDFNLQDAGFDNTTMLGFGLVVTASVPVPGKTNMFTVSGKLTNIPANTAFSAQAGSFSTRFTNKILVVEGKDLFPQDSLLKLDEPATPINIFSYLKGTLSDMVLHRKNGSKKAGSVAGKVSIDFKKTFPVIDGLQMPATLSLTGPVANRSIIFTTDGSADVSAIPFNGDNTAWSLYKLTFKPDPKACLISAEGIALKGKMVLTGLPLVSDISFDISSISIKPTGEIADLVLDKSSLPQMTLDGAWKMNIADIGLDEEGLKLHGSMNLPALGSDVNFSDFIINQNGISGAKLSTPAEGINIIGVAKFKGDNLSIQKLAGNSGLKLAGGGSFTGLEYIAEDITLDNFSVTSKGSFSVASKKGAELDFGSIAKVAINDILLSDEELGLNTLISLDIPKLQAGLGTMIHYKPGNTTLDKIHVDFDLISQVSLLADLEFKNGGFEAEGKVSLMGYKGIGLQMSYFNEPAGKKVGASFTAPQDFAVPIGGVIQLSKITGGFNFDFGQQIYSIHAGGRITFTGDNAGLIAIDNTVVTITAKSGGPVIDGSGEAVLFDSWQVADAHATLDIGAKFIHVDAGLGVGFNLIEGIGFNAAGSVTFEALGSGDPYAFVVADAHASIPYVFSNVGVYIAGGWNADKYSHPELFAFPDIALHKGRIYGGYFSAHSKIGTTKEEAKCIGIDPIGCLKTWYGNESNVYVYGNVKAPSFGIGFGTLWSAGASASILCFDIIEASIAVGAKMDAAYHSGTWNISGTLTGSASASAGLCDAEECNTIETEFLIPCGAKICANVNVGITYSTGAGFDFNVSL